MSFLARLHKRWSPAGYQGHPGKNSYFEGWYVKMVSANGEHRLSLIPGISYPRDGDRHAFIQLIEGNTGETAYFRFPESDFSFDSRRFQGRIGDNHFGQSGVSIDLHSDQWQIKGSLDFLQPTPFPVSLFSPGIMGPFAFAPFLECYHAVVSMHHRIQGQLGVNGQYWDFNGGRGYTEKDWGQSFPSSWIWLHSNHFLEEGDSFLLSIARIPWLGSAFTGFLGFYLRKGRLYRFATYTGARIRSLEVYTDRVLTDIQGRGFYLSIKARRKGTGTLVAPVDGKMERNIRESLSSDFDIELSDSRGKVLHRDLGRFAGLEIGGDFHELLP